MSEYQVKLGVATRRATCYEALYDLPTKLSKDDNQTRSCGTDPWPDGVQCLDCSGQVEWAEAGYASGHRICPECGSHFELYSDKGHWHLRRARFY